MARIFQDGFEYGQPEYLASVGRAGYYGSQWYWSAASSSSTSTGIATTGTFHSPFSSYKLKVNQATNAAASAYCPLPSTISEGYFRCYFMIPAVPNNANACTVLGIQQTGGTAQYSVYATTTSGTLSFYVGASSVGRVAGAYTINQWHLLETYNKISASTGRWTVKIDGVQVLDWTGNSGSISMGRIYVGVNQAATGYLELDSLAANDTTGSVNNSWVGPGVIVGLRPNGAGNYSQWTPSAGDNYAAVDEVPKDDDTTYVSTSGVGNIDTYDMEELVADLGVPDEATVMAVSTHIVARYETSGGNIAPMLRSGSSDDEGTSVAVGSSYNDAAKTQVYSISPFTSSAWTVSEVDGLEAGARFKG